MSDSITLLALFEDIEPAADGIEKLRELGVTDDEMNVISGVPIPGPRPGTPERDHECLEDCAGRAPCWGCSLDCP